MRAECHPDPRCHELGAPWSPHRDPSCAKHPPAQAGPPFGQCQPRSCSTARTSVPWHVVAPPRPPRRGQPVLLGAGGAVSRCRSRTCAVRGGPHEGGQHLHRGGGVGVSSQPFLHLLAEALGHLLEGLLGEPHVVEVLVHLKGAEKAGGEQDRGDLGTNPVARGSTASKSGSPVPKDSWDCAAAAASPHADNARHGPGTSS